MSTGPVLGPGGYPLLGTNYPRVGDPSTEDCCCDESSPNCDICSNLPSTVAVTIAGLTDSGTDDWSDVNGVWSLAYAGVTGNWCRFTRVESLLVGRSNVTFFATLLGTDGSGGAEWQVSVQQGATVWVKWNSGDTPQSGTTCAGQSGLTDQSGVTELIPEANRSSSTAAVSV